MSTYIQNEITDANIYSRTNFCSQVLPSVHGACFDIDTRSENRFGNIALLSNWSHYNDVIIRAMASQISGISIVYLTVGSGTDEKKHQSSASLAFVWGIHRWPENPPPPPPPPHTHTHTQKASNAEHISIWWRLINIHELRYTIWFHWNHIEI